MLLAVNTKTSYLTTLVYISDRWRQINKRDISTILNYVSADYSIIFFINLKNILKSIFIEVNTIA